MLTVGDCCSPPAHASCKGIAPSSSFASKFAPLSRRSYIEKSYLNYMFFSIKKEIKTRAVEEDSTGQLTRTHGK